MAGRGSRRAALRLLATLALVAAPAIVVLDSTPVGALTTIPVTTPTDAALRAAFTTANATADNVEIDINVGAGPINLTAGELSYTGGGGNFALTVKGNGVTIAQTTVGARVFHSTSTGALTLDGMTITGGNLTSVDGAGGAVDSAGPLTITNSTVSHNTSTSSGTGPFVGADILRAGSTTIGPFTATNLTLDSNTITGTGASSNLGFIDTGTTTVTNSTLTNNTSLATGTGAADGVFDTGTITVTGTTIRGNVQTATAGIAFGILDTATTTVTGSSITGNTVTAGGTKDDDGIFDSGTTTVSGSSIVGNTDTAAGTGGAFGTLDASPLTVTDSQVSGNTTHAAGTGNAFGTVDSGTVTLTRSSVTGNTNSSVGGKAFGGIDAGSVTATNTTISDNTASGTTSTGGGIDDGPAPGSGARVASRSAPGGKHGDRGVSAQATSVTILVYATVTANTAQTGANIVSNNSLTAFGSVVALPHGGLNCSLTSGTVSNGWNFSDDASCGFTNTANGDRQSAGDPHLAALANNGGPGLTRLPLPGSPMIDAIPIASCQAGVATDERGVTRPQGAGCDIGALEVVPTIVPTLLLVTPRFTG